MMELVSEKAAETSDELASRLEYWEPLRQREAPTPASCLRRLRRASDMGHLPHRRVDEVLHGRQARGCPVKAAVAIYFCPGKTLRPKNLEKSRRGVGRMSMTHLGVISHSTSTCSRTEKRTPSKCPPSGRL